jgi:hypothetical protein
MIVRLQAEKDAADPQGRLVCCEEQTRVATAKEMRSSSGLTISCSSIREAGVEPLRMREFFWPCCGGNAFLELRMIPQEYHHHRKLVEGSCFWGSA